MLSHYKGLLFVGDIHLARRAPGFRKDDYTDAIFKKVEFIISYSKEKDLLPVFLGDLFHRPRDNANSLLTQLLRLLEGHLVLGVTGNHDITEKELQDDDSLSVIASAGRLHLLDQMGPWQGLINELPTYIGGSAWGQKIPAAFENSSQDKFTVWITHHNIGFIDTEEGFIKPREIPGIHLVVNGHIHKPIPQKTCGMTTWMNPGSITRVQRVEAVRDFVPSVIKLIPTGINQWQSESIPLPHAPFDEVFFPLINPIQEDKTGSAFIEGLESLQSLRTTGGAGLVHFINHNIGQFEDSVAEIILKIVKEICPDEYAK